MIPCEWTATASGSALRGRRRGLLGGGGGQRRALSSNATATTILDERVTINNTWESVHQASHTSSQTTARDAAGGQAAKAGRPDALTHRHTSLIPRGVSISSRHRADTRFECEKWRRKFSALLRVFQSENFPILPQRGANAHSDHRAELTVYSGPHHQRSGGQSSGAIAAGAAPSRARRRPDDQLGDGRPTRR